MTKCAHPNCSKEGTFPAPKDPRDIKARQYFCEEHIKEFNKSWNGLKGMSEDEIFAMQMKSTWERPTWKMGTQSKSFKAAGATFTSADELHRFFTDRQRENAANGMYDNQNTVGADLPPDVKEAATIFNMEPPFDEKKLKRQYLKLIKKNHPDVNNSDKQAEEQVKKINVSYQILKDYAKS